MSQKKIKQKAVQKKYTPEEARNHVLKKAIPDGDLTSNLQEDCEDRPPLRHGDHVAESWVGTPAVCSTVASIAIVPSARRA